MEPLSRTLPPIQLPKYAGPLRDPHRYKVLYGGRAAARSWTFARLGLLEAAQLPIRFLCCREIQNSIRDSVHRLLTDQIDLLQLPGFRVLEKEIRHTVTGSLFVFEGLRYNVNRIKSYEGIERAWVEEAEKVSDISWRTLIPTIRRPGSEIWVSFNPDQDDDPTYKRFVTNSPPDSLVIKVGWEDNPWFPEELRREMEYDYKVDPEAAANTWGGETRADTDAQILHGKWRVEAFEPREDWDGPYQGADWGFSAHPTVLIKVWIGENRLWIEHEAYGLGVDVGYATSRLFDTIPFARDTLIRADNARPETISSMRNGGADGGGWQAWNIRSADKWPGSVEDGIQHLRGYEEIIIHPRCKHAIDEARHYSYKVDRLTGDVLREIVKKHDHIWDAVRYALAPVIRNRTWRPV